MTTIFAHKALLPTGWVDRVRLDIVDGRIASLTADGVADGADCVTDCLVPGLCNAHSHAFQRALAGHTEVRSPQGRDNFWTWRQRMYELAGRIDADALQAIARQVYSEMLASGFTSVVEFHYLNREPGQTRSGTGMFEAIVAAATESGIRLTYVPVLYERAGFESPRPDVAQQAFAMELDDYLAHYSQACGAANGRFNVGVGVHSLRAATRSSLQEIAAVARRDETPLHLHIAEQRREVDQCLARHERRPVRWLLENFEVDEHWCLVHATHIDSDEVEALAQSGAVVCLCPSTEANLGDGLFPLIDFLRHDGNIAIGSDSHISINPFEELRWLEYGQRLRTESRNIVSMRDGHVGSELFTRALQGGAQASGQGISGIREGANADLVALFRDDPMLAGHGDASRMDALVFSGYRLPIERVMVNGRWVVIDGDPLNQAATRARFRETTERLGIGQ